MNELQSAYNSLKSDIITSISIATELEKETGNFLYLLDMENYNLLKDVFYRALRKGEREFSSSVAMRIATSGLDEMLAKAY